jgi:hypothetical protein
MRGFVACRVLVLAVAAGTACHREPSALIRRKEVTTCSAMSVDTLGTVECLVRLHNWKPAEARLAAHLRQREMDSTRSRQEDSMWTIDAAVHRRDVERCKGHEMAECLTLAGWTDEHAKHATDSVWDRNKGRHDRELVDCARRSRNNPAACLMLSYQWDSDRAQAAGDSIMRARMVQPRR